jgi:Xaa-Pro aminopeptidase
MKQGLPETLEIIPWLISELKPGQKVAVNRQMFSVNAYAAMKNELESNGIQLIALDLMAKTWTDRPALPLNKLFVFDVKYAGKSASEKLQILRAELKKVRANAFIMSALDDIAWLFNIRGNDVSYNLL